MDLKVLNISADTDNNRSIKNRTHVSKLKNSLCGDEMQIELVIKNKKILDFGYQGKSCVYCQASASLLSKISINNKKNAIYNLCNDAKSFFEGDLKKIDTKWKYLFKKKNYSRKECILLPFKTLRRIVKD